MNRVELQQTLRTSYFDFYTTTASQQLVQSVKKTRRRNGSNAVIKTLITEAFQIEPGFDKRPKTGTKAK